MRKQRKREREREREGRREGGRERDGDRAGWKRGIYTVICTIKNTRFLRSKQFDVFLSFSREDEEFAEEVRSRLATQAQMRVFVPSDGELII